MPRTWVSGMDKPEQKLSKCLKCGKEFVSRSFWERIYRSCNEENAKYGESKSKQYKHPSLKGDRE